MKSVFTVAQNACGPRRLGGTNMHVGRVLQRNHAARLKVCCLAFHYILAQYESRDTWHSPHTRKGGHAESRITGGHCRFAAVHGHTPGSSGVHEEKAGCIQRRKRSPSIYDFRVLEGHCAFEEGEGVQALKANSVLIYLSLYCHVYICKACSHLV